MAGKIRHTVGEERKSLFRRTSCLGARLHASFPADIKTRSGGK